MGCCVSSPQQESIAPPFVEETVKEVLSETPKSKPLVNVEDDQQKKNAVVSKPKPRLLGNIDEEPTLFGNIKPESQSSSIVVEKETIKKMEKNQAPEEEAPSEEMSQVSAGICSVSDTVSTSTVTEQRVDRSQSKFREYTSPPGKVPVRREKGLVPDSPGRTRTNPTPGRTRPSFGSNKDLSRFAVRRDGSGIQDIGDVSGRRSRSPAMTRTRTNGGVPRSGSGVIGRIPSPQRTAQIRTTKAEESSSSRESEYQAAVAKESLENPLVSLECFIFL